MSIPEEQVVRELNVARSVVRELRASMTDSWSLGANRAVLWSEEGVQRLRERLAAAAGAPPAAASGSEFRVPSSELKRIVLDRTRFVNRRVMHGHIEGEPFDPREPEIVKVVDSGRFVPGMVVLARRIRHHVWDFEGNPAAAEAGRRYPRKVGVW